MRWVRGFFAALALASGTLGAPLALANWGHYPAGLPDVRLEDGSLLLAVLTGVGWLAWGLFFAATLAELLSLLTRRRLRLPGLGMMQQVAGGLLLTVLAVVPAATQFDSPAEAVPAVAAANPQPTLPTPGPAAEPTTDLTTGPTYSVVAGDDLWSISERLLGDGRQWRQLAKANPQLADPVQELVVGAKLFLPESTPEVTSLAAAPTKTAGKVAEVTVRKGDTLSELALEHLGKGSKWPKIARLNPDIADPDHIEVGWRLRMPTSGQLPAAPASKPTLQTKPQSPQTKPRLPAAPSPPSEARPDVDASPSASPKTGGGPSAADQASSRPAERAQTDAAASQPSADQQDAPAQAPLTVGTLAAAAVIGALETRRMLRQRTRPLGQRQPPAPPAADRLRTSLKATERPDGLAALTGALRHVGLHCYRQHQCLPQLAKVRVGSAEIRLEWVVPAPAPPFGFGGDAHCWTAPITPPLPPSDHPCPYPALVSLGTGENGEVLLVDAERSRVLGVSGHPDQQRGALAALGVELACAPWSQDATLIVIGPDAELVALVGEDRVQVNTVSTALTRMRQVVARRREALATTSLDRLRCDPDRAEAVAPQVFVFLQQVPSELVAEFEALLEGDPVGVAVILGTDSEAPALWEVGGKPDQPKGQLTGTPGSFAAHSIGDQTRTDLAKLFGEPAPVSAPWWGDNNVYQLPLRTEEEVDIVRLVEPPLHPRLLLIGAAELHHTAGPEPSRSRQQLIELCTWVLEHPGSTATEMAAGMALAESTRRSNLSRLRTWLGQDQDGELYLPDAYSGRVTLHWGLTSDWQQLQVLLAPGADRVADSTLVAALELVRGAPLADAAPGQWYWAEELRTDIAAALRDVGVVLAERALANHDLDQARWAAARALVVAPEDELLLAVRLRTEHLAGNRADTERLVNQLTRQARVLGVDLMPETIRLCQQVIEGRTRARA